MTSPTPQNITIPEFKDSIPDIKGQVLWTLHYMRGPSPPLMTKLFYHPGPIGETINRAKEHCLQMNYRFISVRQAISNLAEDEKLHAQ